ncbi:MAG: hypothetical protein DRI86_12935 [Bacteroidetes bacterium]|nr:MAG: hypothetical protein DRI86_12935 [Bacteroidota bacterium]
MVELRLSVKDQFIELGNKFFNIKNVEWSNSYDLGYESSTTDPINKYFIEGEERVNEFYDSLLSLLSQLIAFLNFKSQNKNIKSRAINQKINNYSNGHSLNSTFIYRKYKGSDLCNSSAQYNVSRSLIQKLNNELAKTNISNRDSLSQLKTKSKPKNQLRSCKSIDNKAAVNRLNTFIYSIKKWDIKLPLIPHFLNIN